jgi:hypothetical protein
VTLTASAKQISVKCFAIFEAHHNEVPSYSSSSLAAAK